MEQSKETHSYPQIKIKMSPQLSFDIQVEIINRLPVKSLLQFRSVCKAWKSLIDSSHFIAGYNAPPDQPQHLMITCRSGLENKDKHVCFVDDDTFPQQKSSQTIPHLARTTTVIGSSHGLLCVNAYLKDPHDSSLKKLAVLWNPAIRKSITIAVPDEVHPSSPFYYSYVGFGVCPATKDPKLVKIRYIDDQTKIKSISCIPGQVMVFTLSSGEWRCLCSNQLPRKSIQFTSSRTVIGQFIYWLGNDWIDHVNDDSCNVIMSFDLSTHGFKEVHLPHSLRRSILSISRLRESLVLLEDDINFTARKQVCNVWKMEHGYQQVFTKLYTIKAPAPDASFFWTIAFRNNGEAIIAVNDDEGDEHMFSQSALVYDPCLQHIKDLGIRGNRGSLNVNSYTESLLLLNHDAGHIVNCTWSCEELSFGTG